MFRDIDKWIVAVFAFALSLTVSAQGPQPGFDPQRFEFELEHYVTTNAGLTPSEAARFFPLYREMRTKMRVNFGKDRDNFFVNENDDRACERAIRSHDENELQQKKIQQSYHAKFLKLLPATKVFKVLRAEDEFHRRAFKRAARRNVRKCER